MSASKKIYGLIAAALMTGAIAGCGGGGSNPATVPNNVSVNGGIPTDEGIATDANGDPVAIAAGSEQTVNLIVNGQSRSNVTVAPVSQNVPAGTDLAVFPANVPIISNMRLNGLNVSRDPGQLIINGQVIEGVTVDDQGRLSEPIAFAPSEYTQSGRYTVDFDGPWTIAAGNERLDVGHFVVGFEVNQDGASSFPATITGKLPTNGGSTLDGVSFVTFTVNPAFANSTARLTIGKSNGDISKTIDVTGNSGTFSDLFVTGGNATIPAGGVDTVYFEYNPN